MKNVRIVWLLLLAAFVGLMGFSESAFAATKGFVPPAWSQKLPASQRFQLVLDNQAVLDKETGLVWERSPSTTTMNWYAAIYHCYNKVVGGRGGWRLPTVEEYMSLVDRTQGPPTLPAGHPFLNVQSDWYWSATTDAIFTSSAWPVGFGDGTVGFSGAVSAAKYLNYFVWCVRGGHGHDGQ